MQRSWNRAESQPPFTLATKSVVADERPIARNPPPPPHTPTRAVPESLLQPLPTEATLRQAAQAAQVEAVVRSALGAPFFSADGFILYNADCVECLDRLATTAFRASLTITSPPYNIGKSYEQVSSLDEYVMWSQRWFASVRSVSMTDASFWLNVGYLPVERKGRAVPIAYLLWDKTGFFLVQEVVWNYGAGVTSKRAFSPRNEKWLFYVVDENHYTFNLDDVRDPNVKYPNQRKNGKFRCNPLGKNPTDVWQFPKVTSGANRSSRERTPHPAQFPLGVVERIVRVCSNGGEVILDPFSGSGSTGIAAVGSGRVYIGFEKRADYCRFAADRFLRFQELRRNASRQPSLLLSSDG